MQGAAGAAARRARHKRTARCFIMVLGAGCARRGLRKVAQLLLLRAVFQSQVCIAATARLILQRGAPPRPAASCDAARGLKSAPARGARRYSVHQGAATICARSVPPRHRMHAALASLHTCI